MSVDAIVDFADCLLMSSSVLSWTEFQLEMEKQKQASGCLLVGLGFSPGGDAHRQFLHPAFTHDIWVVTGTELTD